MHKILSSVLTALAVVLLPQWVAAQEVKRPDGPRPEMRRQQPNPESMFKRLDANHDGAITPDEIPAGAPERLKQLLKRADRNGDKNLALAEWTEAMKSLPPMGATRGGPPGQQPQRAGGRPGGWPMMPPTGWGPQGGPSPQPHAWGGPSPRPYAFGGPNVGSMSKHDGKQPQAKGMHGGKGHHAKGKHDGKCHHAKGMHGGKCHHAKGKHDGKGHHAKGKHDGKCHHAKGKHDCKGHHAKGKHDGKGPQAKGKHDGKGPQGKGKHEAVKGSCPKSGVCPLAKKGVCPLAKKTEAKGPAAKKPEPKKPEAKSRGIKVEVMVTADKKAIEAKLAALEKEKAATINSLQKAQQAAAAKMHELNKQRAEILQSLHKEKAAEPKK